MAWAASGYGLGVCVGSMTRGALQDFNKYRVCIVLVWFAVTSLGSGLIPWCTNVVVMVMVVAVQGCGIGAIETDGIALSMDIWGEKGATYVLFMYLLYNVGCSTAPLLARSFLEHEAEPSFHLIGNHTSIPFTEDAEENRTSQRCNYTTTSNCSHELNWGDHGYVTFRLFGVGFHKIHTLYMIIMILVWTAGSFVTLANLLVRRYPQLQAITKEADVQNSGKIGDKCVRINIIVLIAIFSFFIEGIDSLYDFLLLAFAVRHYGVTKPYACILNATTSASSILSSVVGMYLANLFKPSVTLYTDLIVCTVSLALVAVVNKSLPVLWVGGLGMGFGVGSCYSAVFNWFGHYLGGSAKITSVIIVASQLGDILLPIVIAPFFDNDPMVLIYTCLLLSCFCFAICVIVEVYAKRQLGLLGLLQTPPKSYSALRTDEEAESEWTLRE
ncbi:sodium-dependent glucose transporter 1B-like [Lineus longissimus]|uniref:sodium-dependent glucose transporter 1B-like n=1 Tax=Lineus longissimus TaxID=88925 RepID=UPI00315D7D9A